MKRALAATLMLAGCRDWAAFSAHYGVDAGIGGGLAAAGGGSGGGGAGGGTAGGSGAGGGAAGGGSATGGGSTGGGSTGGGTAGSGGGAPVDDPLSCDGARASVCPAGNLFCDGYENALPGPWSVETMNGTAALTDTCTFRGGHALKSVVNAVGGGVVAYGKTLESASGGPATQYIRAFIRLQGTSGPSVRLLDVKQSSPGTADARLVLSAGQLSAGSSSGSNPTSTASFPANRWVCVEWRLVEGSPGTSTVWLDGTQVITGPLEPSNLVRLGVGLQLTDHASATTGVEAYFDEIVVDDAPIGCAN